MSEETEKGSGTTQEGKLGFEPKTSYVPGYPPGDQEGDRDEVLFNQSNRDLALSARKTLGNFLSDVTAGKRQSPSPNAFQSPGGSSETQLYDRNTGLPVDLVNTTRQKPSDAIKEYEDTGGTQGAFQDLVEGYDPDASSKFNVTSQGEYGSGKNPFYNADDFGEILYNKNQRKKGHTLLPNVKPVGSTKEVGNAVINELPSDAPSIQKRISNVLLNNRFNPKGGESPFLTNFSKTGGKFGYSVQKDMGVYNPSTDGAPDVTIDDLKKIGASLMVRASGHGGPMGLGFESDDPASLTLLDVFLPSTTQLGLVKPSVVELRAQNAYGAENITKIRSELLSELDDSEVEWVGLGGGSANSQSYGNLNSHLETFGGALPSGMIWQAMGGVIALLAFSALVNLITAGFWWDDDEDVIDLTNLSMGRHMPDGFWPDMASMFNIPIVDSHFQSCMMYGIMSFCGFSFDPMSSTPQKLLDGALNISTAAGYYAVMFRTIIRDVGAVTSAVSDLAMKLPTIGIMGGIESVFAIIESVTMSATWRFLMVMVKVGNIVLYSRHGHPRLFDPEMDDLPEGPRTRHMKSRLKEGVGTTLGGSIVKSNALAWRHSANVSRYIMPESLDLSLKAMSMTPGKTTGVVQGTLKGMIANPDGTANDEDKSGKGNIFEKFEDKETNAIPGRLSSEYVRYVEDALDSEYMPFYFHDLRTNEIISFHAFLNTLSDSFSPDWTDVSGYGRMDPVKIHSKTTRAISIDFTLVSTSEQDFDRMWWDINKLVSMVYPQWSKGRARTQGDEGFIQPFSQIPTASPVIRMRFGDVIKSNYSKFNLARLFGVGTTAFKTSKDPEAAKKRAEWAKNSGIARKKMAEKKKSSEMMPLDPQAGGLGGDEPVVPLITFSGASKFPEIGYQKGDIVVVKPGHRTYFTDKLGNSIPRSNKYKRRIKTQSWKMEVVGFWWSKKSYKITKAERQGWKLKNKTPPSGKRARHVYYVCKFIDPSTEAIPKILKDKKYEYMNFHHTRIIGLHKDTLDDIYRKEMKKLKSELPPRSEPKKPSNDETAKFFKSDNNFVVKAFESTRGRGMAGVITSLGFDWGESTWDDSPGRRAPQWLKVSISFAPIHDLPLGLDYDGALRAPAYNVGRIVEALGGDPYAERSARDGKNPNERYFAKVSKHVNDNPEPIEEKDEGE